jgi:hypothetical protein
MPFQNVAVRQALPILSAGAASPITRTLNSAVLAGSTLVFVGTAISADTPTLDQAALLTAPSGGGTWTGLTNTRASGDFVSNVCSAAVYNVSAGTPSISLPFTVAGSAAASVRLSGVLFEIEKVPTTSVIQTTKTGIAAGGTTTTTDVTGTLSQTDNLAILIAGGWFGIPSNPSGWTSHLTQQNGQASLVGCQVSSRKLTATTSIAGSVTHEAIAAGDASAILVILKAAGSATLYYEFEFNSQELPASESGIEALIARNEEPMATGSKFEYYSGLTAEAGTKPGDPTVRFLRVRTGLPTGITTNDTLRGSFRKAGTPTKGSAAWIIGNVISE